MTIRANVIKIKKDMLMEVGETSKPICDKISKLALKAIDRGKGSAEWNEYMALFAAPGNEAQLKRLQATDNTADDDAMNEARAYLLADGPCTPDTVLNFGNGASETLDEGLA
ncbi:MAG TPA: hypothetical protein VLB46_22940 [Pyrinomonadaceae bacterium]|nr:hypothetical protein [Pyrinomonadaceae bacterium]